MGEDAGRDPQHYSGYLDEDEIGSRKKKAPFGTGLLSLLTWSR